MTTKTTRCAAATAVLGLLLSAAAAAQPASVEAVQSPAWLDRGGRAVPLAPGIALQARDRVRTGGNARVRLRLAEGSAVKLGENAEFVIERAEERGVFRAGLDVLAGAFRFTTQALQRARPRDVSIRVKTLSVGIRGTDLWGKSTPERDWVVLLEGRITIAAEGSAPVTLEQPLDLYQKPRDAAPERVRADPGVVAQWAQETEIPGDPGEARGGGWRVVAARAANRDSALVLARRLRAAGFAVEVVPAEQLFALHVSNLASEAQAREVMGNLRAVPGITLPKIEPAR